LSDYGHTVPRDALPLRLVQISDCHVSADSAAIYRGIDPRANFETLLQTVAAWRPQLLLVTGDLAEDGSQAAYRYLAGHLGRLGVPVLTLPGNHDLPEGQAEVFGHCPVRDPLVHDAGGWRLILLNSVAEGQVPGKLSTRMLDGLEKALDASARPTAVFLHHPPLPVGSPWIDKYPLLEPERLWAVLDKRDAVRFVAWGHVHQAYDAMRGRIRLLGAPSSAANSLPGQARFTHDPAGPACRWCGLRADGEFETGILAPG